MPLTLHRVPSFSAGEPLARECWRDRGGYLAVPRAEAVGSVLARETREHGLVLDREVLTLAALRARVFAAAGLAQPALPTRLGARLAIAEVLTTVDLGPLAGVADTPGFLTALERALAEIRAAGVSADAVVDAAAGAHSGALAGVVAALRSAPHPADRGWAAADAARGLSSFPPVAVTGVDDLDPATWALLRVLSERTEVTVVVPFDRARAAFEARHARQARWSADAVVVDAAPPAPPGPPALARRLFDDGPPHPSSGAVRFVGAAGTRGLLRAAVEEALAAIRSGVPAGGCAIVVPRLAELRDDLDRLLDDWGVDARRTTNVRVLEAPIALALTHLLRLGEMDPHEAGALEHLLGWLRTPYGGARPDEVDRFEIAARRAGTTERAALAARWEGEAIAPVRRLVAAAAIGPRVQLAALVEVGWAGLRRASSAGAPPGRADRRDRAALAALAALSATLADDDEAIEDRPVRARGPLPPGALGRLVADLTFPESSGPPEGVAVHDPASLRGNLYDVVIVAGVDGDGLPARPAPDALLGPMRSALADVLVPRAPGTSESRLRFVHAVDAARRRLVLVRRVVDDEGREVAPSPYWLEVARVAGVDPAHLDRGPGGRGEVLARGDDAPTEREALRAIALDGGVTPGPLAEATRRRVRPLGVPAGAFDDRMAYRVTELETLIRCPYGWLHGSYIGPQRIEDPVDAREEGSIAHAALEAAYAAMRDAGIGPCRDATLERYRLAVARQLDAIAADRRAAGRSDAVFAAAIGRLQRHLPAMLGREAALRSEFVPTLLETALRDETLVADLAPGVVITGTVDRIDVSRDGERALVVDYKRSGATLKVGSERVHERLQLPLYGVLATDGGHLSAEPVGGLYVGLLAPDIDGVVRDDVDDGPALPRRKRVDADEWDRLVAEAVEAVRTAVGGLRAGGALAGPPRASCPPWCGCGDLWR